MFYITGDTHGNFLNINEFCNANHTTKNDTIIILGDAGINYYEDKRDYKLKEILQTLPITIFSIHGNHEQRPEVIPSYNVKKWNGGEVYFEKEFPNLLFAKDGEVYNINNKKCLVIGGAYSVDKFFRLSVGYKWFSNEQPSIKTKTHIEEIIKENKFKFDCILTHTSPQKYEPVEFFLPQIDQSTVDKTTEQWLDKIENRLVYKKWYCGHYHCEKTIDNIEFLYKTIKPFEV